MLTIQMQGGATAHGTQPEKKAGFLGRVIVRTNPHYHDKRLEDTDSEICIGAKVAENTREIAANEYQIDQKGIFEPLRRAMIAGYSVLAGGFCSILNPIRTFQDLFMRDSRGKVNERAETALKNLDEKSDDWALKLYRFCENAPIHQLSDDTLVKLAKKAVEALDHHDREGKVWHAPLTALMLRAVDKPAVHPVLIEGVIKSLGVRNQDGSAIDPYIFATVFKKEGLTEKEKIKLTQAAVHPVLIENSAQVMSSHIFETNPVTHDEAGKILNRFTAALETCYAIRAKMQRPGFITENINGTDRHTPNEAFKLKSAVNFLKGEHMQGDSGVDIAPQQRSGNLAQLVAGLLKAQDNPNMNWHEGLSDTAERKKDFINRMIDTFYDCQRGYNIDLNNSDNREERDFPSCFGGSVNRITVTAGLFINPAPKGAEENFPVPTSGDYAGKFSEIANKILEEITPENLTREQNENMRNALNGKAPGDALPEAVFYLLQTKIRDGLKEEFPALKQERNGSAEEGLWREAQDFKEYLTIPDKINAEFLKYS